MKEALEDKGALECVPKGVREAIGGRYELCILTAPGPLNRQAVCVVPDVKKYTIVVHECVFNWTQEEKLKVLFHEYAHVYCKHGSPPKGEEEEEAERKAQMWLAAWRHAQQTEG